MPRPTNANRTRDNIIDRELRLRVSGHWPAWVHHAIEPAGETGWRATATKLTENGIFSVLICEGIDAGPWGRVTHAMVRTASDAPDITWAEKQRIKDGVFGRERIAIEVYPKSSRLVDDANLYHLWVFPQDADLPIDLMSMWLDITKP